MIRGGRLVLAAALGAVLAMAGCRGSGSKSAPAKRVAPAPRAKAPEYKTIAEAYNTRVAPLEKIWSTATIRIWYPDDQGEEQTDQVEAHFQYIRPSDLLLTFEKVGETYAALGCNEQQYWWIDKKQDRKAYVGTHAQATAERIAELGLPVHPLDLIEVMGITPIPTTWNAYGPGETPQVRMSDDGQSVIVTTLGRNGPRRLWLNPVTLVPSRIELLGAGGKVLVSADLRDFQTVQVRPDPEGPVLSGSMPTRVLTSVDRGRVRVRMTLYDPQVGGSRPKPAAFDFQNLVKSLNVGEIEDMDAPRPAVWR